MPPRLVGLSRPPGGKVFPLVGDALSIGRDPSQDVF
jgi:hypothetical protein